eukprot:TRINITY_DN8509_c1_g2_i1.p1 TRINITY_DN8509_c1_g2~~TRINITY_DN8509_c1_g2_i1.p1  ORF type:complete len:479 (+),score=79.96 TRINITY_DN8509_c1_g2_i1:200-1438(+)
MAMRRSFDVLICGGGGMGSSAAYWLSRAGLKVGVLERDPTYKTASSTLSAGGIRVQFSNKENIQLSQESLAIMKNPEHMEMSIDELMFKEGGYLLLSGSDAGMDVLRENLDVQKGQNCDTKLCTTTDLKKMFPWIETDGLKGGGYGNSGEGWFDPALMMGAFRKRAQSYGAQFIVDDLIDIKLDGKTAVEAKTKNGQSITFSHLINATGCNAASIASKTGWENMPVGPRKRYVFMVESEEWTNTPSGCFHKKYTDSDELRTMPLFVNPNGVWIRPEGRGFICGVSPAAENDPQVAIDDFNIGEESSSLWEDIIWPTLAERIEGMDALRTTHMWVGHYDYNAVDQNALIGFHDSCHNVVYVNGFSGHGIQQSPAAGRAVSELVLHGQYETIDLSRMTPNRISTNELLIERNVV